MPNPFHFFDAEETKQKRITAKRDIEKARLDNKVKIAEIKSRTPKRAIIKQAVLVCSIIIVTLIAISLLSTYLVKNTRNYEDVDKILNVASLTVSIVLSILAIIFTLVSGLNLEERFHSIDQMQGDYKSMSDKINVLMAQRAQPTPSEENGKLPESKFKNED